MGLYELLTHVKFISAKPKAAAEIRSTKNAMHAEKKKQRVNCRLKKAWLCPEHVQSEKQWLQCAGAAGA